MSNTVHLEVDLQGALATGAFLPPGSVEKTYTHEGPPIRPRENCLADGLVKSFTKTVPRHDPSGTAGLPIRSGVVPGGSIDRQSYGSVSGVGI